MVIYLLYSEFYRDKTGRSNPLASIQASPLGCCGAVGIIALSVHEDTTYEECHEILSYVERYRQGHRGLIAIPIKPAISEDNTHYVDRCLQLWQGSALSLGWKPLGESWFNPNTGRILQMYYKDFT